MPVPTGGFKVAAGVTTTLTNVNTPAQYALFSSPRPRLLTVNGTANLELWFTGGQACGASGANGTPGCGPSGGGC